MTRPRLIGWWLVLITLLAYLPGLRNGFVNFDDPDYVTQNPVVQAGLTWPGIQWAFTGWHASNWHPLTWLSHMADCQLFRLNPAGHHLVSLLFHAANVGLLFHFWRKMTGAVYSSALIAALFAWHPLHVESVAWVAERKDVLSTFFALLALWSYVCHVQAEPPPPAPSAFWRSRFYWLTAAFLALGLMAKPMVVTLPCVLLLLDFWPLQRARPVASLIWEKGPLLLLSLAGCALTLLAQRTEAIEPLAKYSLGLRAENVLTAYAGYLGQTFWPAQLAAFYPLVKPAAATLALAAAVCGGITAWTVRQVRTQPWLAVGWLWYLGTLVPVIGWVQVGDQAMADRYTYFPLIGIFAAVTWAAKTWVERHPPAKWVILAAAGCVLAGCLAATENQLRFWRSSETLFAHALAVTPDNASARLNLGEAYQAENRPDAALTEYRRALALDAARPEVYNNLGRLLNDAGQPAAALDYCRTAVALNPRSPQSHNGLGLVLAELGRGDEALAQFAEAERRDPHYAAPHFQAGRVLLQMGRDAEAAPEFQLALQLDSGNWGMMIYIARVLAADQNPLGRDGPAALRLAQQALLRGGPASPAGLDTLAMAWAETGHFDAAVLVAQQALAAARAGGDLEDTTNLLARLAQYQKHEPARITFKRP
jgi:tetratricopeptide (TPR) repeat protein